MNSPITAATATPLPPQDAVARVMPQQGDATRPGPSHARRADHNKTPPQANAPCNKRTKPKAATERRHLKHITPRRRPAHLNASTRNSPSGATATTNAPQSGRDQPRWQQEGAAQRRGQKAKQLVAKTRRHHQAVPSPRQQPEQGEHKKVLPPRRYHNMANRREDAYGTHAKQTTTRPSQQQELPPTWRQE